MATTAGSQSDLTDPPRFLDYPYSVSGSGSPTRPTADDHLRDLILQVLFTNPGRAGQPAGVRRRRAAAGFRAEQRRAARERPVPDLDQFAAWLGDRIDVEQVDGDQRAWARGDGDHRDRLHGQATQQRQRVQVQV